MAKLLYPQVSYDGFMFDVAPDTLPAGAASDGYNMKATSKGWAKSDGFKETGLVPNYEVTHLQYWTNQDGDNRWFVASSEHIEYIQGLSVTDVTRVAATYQPAGEYLWSSVNFNGVIIFNNQLDAPQYFAASLKFEDITDIDNTWRFRRIRKFGAYLIGIGPDVGSGFQDNYLLWSNPADPGFLPNSWDYTDPTTDAGLTPLTSAGHIIDCLEMGNENIVYKSDSIWVMTLIGGSFIFNFENRFPGQGLLAPDCVTAFEGKHFLVTQNDIIVHDGIRMQSIADKRVKDKFFKEINTDIFSRSFAITRQDATEIQLYYPSQQALTGCDRILIWNWRDDTWEFRIVPEINHAAYGYPLVPGPATWEEAEGVWEQPGTWYAPDADLTYIPLVHLAFKDKTELLVPTVISLFVGEEITAEWIREDIQIGNISRDGVIYMDYSRQKIISRISFTVDSVLPFRVYLAFKEDLNDPLYWEDFGEIDPEVNKNLDLFETCTFLSIKIVTTATEFVLRRLSLEYEFNGDAW